MTALYQYCEKCKTERAFIVHNSLDISCTNCKNKIKSVPGRSAIPAGRGLLSQVHAGKGILEQMEEGPKNSYHPLTQEIIDKALAEKEWLKPYVDKELVSEMCYYGNLARVKGVKGTFVTGTAGEDSADIEQMKKMFYDPESYGMLPVKQSWTEKHMAEMTGSFLEQKAEAFATVGMITDYSIYKYKGQTIIIHPGKR